MKFVSTFWEIIVMFPILFINVYFFFTRMLNDYRLKKKKLKSRKLNSKLILKKAGSFAYKLCNRQSLQHSIFSEIVQKIMNGL